MHGHMSVKNLQTSLSTDCHLNSVFITSTVSQLPITQRCNYEVIKVHLRCDYQTTTGLYTKCTKACLPRLQNRSYQVQKVVFSHQRHHHQSWLVLQRLVYQLSKSASHGLYTLADA